MVSAYIYKDGGLFQNKHLPHSEKSILFIYLKFSYPFPKIPYLICYPSNVA